MGATMEEQDDQGAVAEMPQEAGEQEQEQVGAPEGEKAEEQGEDAEQEDTQEEAEEQAPGKLTPEQQEAFNKAMARKQRKVREARERAEKAEKELAELKAQNSDLTAKVGDEAVLVAMQNAGVLPEYVNADEAKLVGENDTLKARRRWLNKLVRAGEEYRGLDQRGQERTWTVEQLGAELDAVEERLERIGGRAEGIKARIVEEYRKDLEAGRKARKGGGEPGTAKPKPKPKPAATVAPPAMPEAGGARRSDPTHGGRTKSVDWSKVTSPEEMEAALREEARSRAGR